MLYESESVFLRVDLFWCNIKIRDNACAPIMVLVLFGLKI